MAFPPVPVYPLQLDSDRTLFLVYNTTESRLSANNQPWSAEIDIDPVASTANEIWADNGFGTIGGELFYYDSVTKNSYGKVIKLKGCARNIGGNHTRFNAAGSWVRSYVIAEHHNQLVDAIIAVEEFIHDVAVRLDAIGEECVDDYNCVDIYFSFVEREPTTDSSTACDGTIVDYLVTLVGSYTNARVDFGDGTWTNNLNGTHTYAPNTTIDPVVTVENEFCTLVQTPPTTRVVHVGVQPAVTIPYTIPFPSIPDIPPFTIPSFTIPSTTITFPQIILPNLDIGTDISFTISIPPISVIMPSVITITPPIPNNINITGGNLPSIIEIVGPSTISFVCCDIPSVISFVCCDIPSVISFVGCGIPSVVSVTCCDIPSSITIDCCNIPSVIELTGISLVSVQELTGISFVSVERLQGISLVSVERLQGIDLVEVEELIGISLVSVQELTGISQISIIWGVTPTISVNWGTCSCTILVSCASPPAVMAAPQTDFDTFEDGFNRTLKLTPDITPLGIPSEITVLVPDFPSVIQVHSDLPSMIQVNAPTIPSVIEIKELLNPLPNEIRIINETNLPSSIALSIINLAEAIKVDASSIPTSIDLVAINLPEKILIDASDIPDKIQVIGIPSAIELKGQIPSEIFVKVPENMEIPLVYKGGPIPVQFDLGKLGDPNDDGPPCFAITPCPKR